jgi:hypothetical protein
VIVLNLCCDAQHEFEGWFASNDAFRQQTLTKEVLCPICGSYQVSRRPAAPYVQRSARVGAIEMLRSMIENAEDVGSGFAEEARRIHYGEADERAIRGVATGQQTAELLDEGIPVIPLPGIVKKSAH